MRRYLHGGFTLLETLMAVTILALIVSSVYRTWNMALSGWKRATDVSDVLQRQRVVLEVLSELTKSVVFVNTETGLYGFSGENDPTRGPSISFVTASELLLPSSEASLGGLRRVSITLMRDAERGSYLAVQNRPALLEEERAESVPPWHVLSTGVIGFFVRYRSPLDGSWTDTWEDDSFIPAA
ncbi:MAG: type II secretion system GspH family protein, partial [Verrucomicrobiae bacterium]|nr:type II secretion system GspH family protein [Verrucomicrobiae bacterium]